MLDGAIDSTISHQDFDLDRAEGYENALHSYVQACLEGKAGDTCPLTGDVKHGVQQIRDLIASADASPLKTSDPDVRSPEPSSRRPSRVICTLASGSS